MQQNSTNADAIHPGYGFLSESEMFAEIIETNKFKFIGPTSKVLNKMGDKIKAKKAMKVVFHVSLDMMAFYPNSQTKL